MAESSASVVALAMKSRHGGPMVALDVAMLEVDGPVGGAPRESLQRSVTLLDAAAWEAATAECGPEALSWHARRANILVTGVDLGPCIGRSLEVGPAVIEILGETDPCSQMEAARPGLREALAPACRGGVFGRVRRGGMVRPGDPVRVV
jgi:MOSC domain-containing protein YiiM